MEEPLTKRGGQGQESSVAKMVELQRDQALGKGMEGQPQGGRGLDSGYGEKYWEEPQVLSGTLRPISSR